MQLFGWTLTRTKADAVPPLQPIRSGGRVSWWPIVREPYTGAWQRNDEIPLETAVNNPTVYACVYTIATDIAKLHLALVEQETVDVWTETSNPAFSPVLRTPNRYQTPFLFIQQWMQSKLLWGNTYVLKQRDARGVVVALYVLDPTRVVPLVAPDGSIYYQINKDWLSEQTADATTVPARDIIHDRMFPIFHPLVGVPPIFACGYAAAQGLIIQRQSAKFFQNSSIPGGVLVAPGTMRQEQADAIMAEWVSKYGGDNAGKVALLSGGLKYEHIGRNAVDSQLIEQLQWSDSRICAAYRVPAFLVGVGDFPPYASVEAVIQLYHAECLQGHITPLEQALDDGLGLTQRINGTQYGTQCDVDDLIWMDTLTRAKAATDAAGTLSPNESRAKYFGMPPVPGGDAPMVQQQYYSLPALAERDASKPFVQGTPGTPGTPAAAPGEDLTPDQIAAAVGPLFTTEWTRAA